MSVMVYCPACGQVVDATTGDTACPHCGSAFPAALATSVAEAVRRERPPKPFLIKLLAFLLGLWSVTATIAVVAFVSDGMTTYTFNDVPVTHEQLMDRAGGALALFAALALATGATAWALHRERVWGRHVLLATFAAAALGPTAVVPHTQRSGDLAITFVFVALLLAPIAWYLYRKRNVVAYYRELATKDRR